MAVLPTESRLCKVTETKHLSHDFNLSVLLISFKTISGIVNAPLCPLQHKQRPLSQASGTWSLVIFPCRSALVPQLFQTPCVATQPWRNPSLPQWCRDKYKDPRVLDWVSALYCSEQLLRLSSVVLKVGTRAKASADGWYPYKKFYFIYQFLFVF